MVDLLAQEAHVGLGGVLVDLAVGAPHAREQVLLGDDAAGAAHEHAHDLELLLREVHVSLVAGEVVRVEVELEVAEGHLVEHDLALSAGEGAHAGLELLGLEGLGHVVVGAAVESSDLVGGGRLGREHHDRQVVAVPAKLAHDLEAVHARQHDVEDDGVVQAALGEGEAGGAVVGGLGLVAVLLEDVADGVGEVALVLNDQNVHGGPFPWLSTNNTNRSESALKVPETQLPPCNLHLPATVRAVLLSKSYPQLSCAPTVVYGVFATWRTSFSLWRSCGEGADARGPRKVSRGSASNAWSFVVI